MRHLTLAIGLTMASAAQAQEPPTPFQPGPALIRGEFEAAGDVDRYTTRLQKGSDYAVLWYVTGAGQLRVKAPGGSTLLSIASIEDVDAGGELRAKRSGIHTVELTASSGDLPAPYYFRLMTDCRAADSTQCRIKPAAPQDRQFAFAGDADWHRASLKAGRTYVLSVTPIDDIGAPKLAFRDAKGKALAQNGDGAFSLAYKARTDGRHFMSIQGNDDHPGRYRVTLTVR